MNGQEQKHHKTALTQLAIEVSEALKELADATEERVRGVESSRAADRAADLAALDVALTTEMERRTRAVEHLSAMININRALLDATVWEMEAFAQRGFWRRLEWLIAGMRVARKVDVSQDRRTRV